MRKRDAYLDEHDDDEVEDGRAVRVPMMIIDGNRVNLTDTVRFEDGQPHFLCAVDVASESSNFEDLESQGLGICTQRVMPREWRGTSGSQTCATPGNARLRAMRPVRISVRGRKRSCAAICGDRMTMARPIRVTSVRSSDVV
jgi:hypothetical protein